MPLSFFFYLWLDLVYLAMLVPPVIDTYQIMPDIKFHLFLSEGNKNTLDLLTRMESNSVN